MCYIVNELGLCYDEKNNFTTLNCAARACVL